LGELARGFSQPQSLGDSILIVRQGDVLVMSVDTVPDKATEVPLHNGAVVLAFGEVTGHSHQIKDSGVALLELPDTEDRFMQIVNANGAFLKHEEHATIYFPPGNYRVRVQREYTSAEMPSIRVSD
jgi:hypothetical protein